MKFVLSEQNEVSIKNLVNLIHVNESEWAGGEAVPLPLMWPANWEEARAHSNPISNKQTNQTKPNKQTNKHQQQKQKQTNKQTKSKQINNQIN